MITHATYFGENLLHATRYHEIAAGIGHTTCEKGRIPGIEQSHIGKLHWSMTFINHPSHQFSRFLLGTFHEYQAILYRSLHRIKSKDPPQSFLQIEITERGSDGEIFQFIIDKTDFISTGSLV